MTDTPTNAQVATSAAIDLQQIIEEERTKRIEAENYTKALIEEFTSCNGFEEVRNKFREKIKEHAPAALVNIVNLANNAESESVRANLNKWILDWAMSDKIDNSGSELNGLLNELRKQPASTSTSPTSQE